jgi:hypothetical protein
VKETVENHLKEMIIKHFDPKKADDIFYGASAVSKTCDLLMLLRV